MFEVLNNTESTVEQLVESYVKAVKLEETLKTALEQAYRLLMDIQKNFLDPDKKDSKELKEARLHYEDSSVKLESCQFSMKQIKDRMIERLPVESQGRRKEIEREFGRLQKKRQELWRSYLQKVAEAIVIEEEIKGIAITTLSRDGSIVEAPFRNTELGRLSNEDSVFLHSEVEKRRQSDCRPIDAQITALSEEAYRLEKVLEFDDEQRKERVEEIITQAIQDTPPAAFTASS